MQWSLQGSSGGLNLAHYNNPNLRGMAGMTQWRGPNSQEWPFRMPNQQGSLPQLSQQLGSLPQMSQQLGLPQMSQQQLGSLPQMGQQMALQPLAMQQQMAQQMQVWSSSEVRPWLWYQICKEFDLSVLPSPESQQRAA